MATWNLTDASNVLKDVYLPRLRQQLNDELSPTFAALEKSTRNVEGEKVVLAIHTGRNPGTGSRVELGDLPTAGFQKYQRVVTDLRYHYGSVQFSGPLMRRTKTDAGSWVRAASTEMERLTMDLKHVYNRQIFNDANGSLALVGSVAAQVITLDNPSPTQMRSFVIGMALDIGTAGAATAGADSVVVSAVDKSAGTVTVVGTITSVVGGHIVRMEDSAGAEITGLQAIINSGDTLFGLDGAAVEVWNSYVDSNGGTNRTPTEALFEKAIDEIHIEAGKVPDLCVAPHDVVRNFQDQLTSIRRYNDTREFDSGFQGVSVATGSGSLNFVSDRFCPANTAFLINTSEIVFNTASDWEWMQEDGSVLQRVPGKDAYFATMFQYSEMTTDKRNSHGVIRDLQGAS